MSKLIGTALGPYRIIEQIGLGGMATVYKAYQPSMERYVALKILSTHLTQTPTFVKRFQQEAKVIARLEHLHILPVYDHGEENDYLYLVMRFIEAGTLKDRFTPGGMSLEETRRVVSQVGSALEYAHQMGVIHRDLKPSNILVDRHGDCYLTDFGIARMVEDDLGLTGSSIIGTPQYMAPEQGESARVDHRADIYAMGVVIYEMLTGRPPYDAETPFAVVMKHLTEPLPLPSSLRPDLPEEVELVILKALAKNPADRYQSMADLVAVFNRAVQAAPAGIAQTTPAPPVATTVEPAATATPPASSIWRRWLAAQPPWLLGAAVLGLIVLLVAGLILSRVPGQVEISGGQVQVILPTNTPLPIASSLPTATVAAVVPPTIIATPTRETTDTPKPISTPTVLPTSAATSPVTSPTPAAVAPQSSTAGWRWEKLTGNTTFLPVTLNTLAVDPNNSNIIFAGTYGAGIYVSHDGGETWTPSNQGLGKGTVGSIVIDPKDSNLVYTALFHQGGVYKSTDGGQTWQTADIGLDLDQAWNWLGLVYIDPTDSRRLYYTGTTDGLYLSTNAGVTWSKQSGGCVQITGLTIDPADGNHLYASSFGSPDEKCPGGIYESTDSGQTWQPLITNVTAKDNADWWHVATNPRDFGTIYAGGKQRIYKTSDSGKSWTPILDSGCDWLVASDTKLYCGSGENTSISSDGGETWQEVFYGAGGGGQERQPFAVDANNPQILYGGSDEVMKSTDGGLTWNRLSQLGAAPMHLVVDPRAGSRLFLNIIGRLSEIYRSEDGGVSWQTLISLPDVGNYLTIEPTHGTIYFPTWTGMGKLYRSGDNGQTWETFGNGYIMNPRQLVPDPRDTAKLWLASECQARLSVSEDGGNTFDMVKDFPTEVCLPLLLFHEDGKRMYVVTGYTVYRSDDNGATWRSIDGPGGYHQTGTIDPTNADVVYIGSTHNGVLKTENGGETWRLLNAGLTNPSINSIVLEPTHPQTIYIATDGGVFVSFNGGQQWHPIQEGLGPNLVVYSITVDPNNPAKIYAATPDGIFRLVGAGSSTE